MSEKEHMRKLIFVLLLTGCASAARHEQFLEVARQNQACFKDPNCNTPEKRKALADQEMLSQRERIRMAAGTSILEYMKYFGSPDSKELLDGKEVYWYNDAQPFFAVFQNGKLVSYIIDRSTINRREDQREAQGRDEAAAHQRRMQAWGDAINQVGQSINRKSSVDCTTRSYGNQANTHCE
jgi:hypothetical protein